MTTTAVTDIVDTVKPEPRTLRRMHDRCDRCGAEAFVQTTLVNGQELLWCGHHYTKFEARLAALGVQVVDERESINKQPSISANAE